MENNKVNVNLGCGSYFLPLVFIILLVAKLFVNANISWLMVFSPIILGIIAIIIALLVWILILLWKKI
jgi:hypothetical protein